MADTINKVLVQRTASGGGIYTDFVPATEIGIGVGPNVTARPPRASDNTSLGYTTSSLWQYLGMLYSPSTYCATDCALWTPLSANDSPGTPTDVMGTALTKFAGGTCSMLKGYVGAAVDVAITIGGVYQIFTVNILSTGELDVVSLGAAMAQADAGTDAKVIKLYDQTGNANHAALVTATGVPCAINGTISTSTTLTVNSTTTGTVAVGQTLYGNGVTVGTTLASGAGPFTLSAGSPLNPGPETMYLGIQVPPYIDWDPILARYCIYSPNDQVNRRSLQLPQVCTFTNANNIGVYAVGVGTNSSDTSEPCLGAVGDSTVGTTNYLAIFGGAGSPQNVNGQLIVTQNGTARSIAVPMRNQPCVLIMGTASTPLTTLGVNEDQATSATAITSQALAGGNLFSYGGGALISYGLMKIVGIAMFNAAPTVTQTQQLRYGSYCRFNIFPQVVNQIALIGDSRFASFGVLHGFGIGSWLPWFVGRNWDLINLSTHSQAVQTQIGDGLVPTVTGIAKSLQTFRKPGMNYAIILAGVNDFAVNSSTVPQVVGFLQTLCAQIVAAGWTPVLLAELTTTNTGGSNGSVSLPLLRAAIIAAGSAAFSGAIIIDLYGYTPVVTPSNANFYSIGLHPTLALHQLIASVIAPFIPIAQVN